LKELLSSWNGIPPMDRFRLVLIVIVQHGFLTDHDLDDLIAMADLTQTEKQILMKLRSVGLTNEGMAQRNAPYHESRKKYCKTKIQQGNRERYAPLIKYFLDKETENQKDREITKRRVSRLRVEYDTICKMDFDAPDEANRAIRLENYKFAWTNLDVDGRYSEKQMNKSFNKLSSNGVIPWPTFRDTMLQEWNKPTGNHIPISALSKRENRSKRKWGEQGREAARKEQEESPWIIFFLGGVSFNEIREIRRFAESRGRNIYIGATELLSARTYMNKFIQSN